MNLVASKCQLAPPNGETIPCLELLGALLGARLLNSLRKEYKDFLKIDAELLCLHSSVVLAWINQGARVGGVFVANRVEEITAVGGVWSWVPTDETPADLPTRGTTVSQLSVRRSWWNGPCWLNGPQAEWPKHPRNDTNVRPSSNVESHVPNLIRELNACEVRHLNQLNSTVLS